MASKRATLILPAMLVASVCSGMQPPSPVQAPLPHATRSDVTLVGAGTAPRAKVRFAPPIGSAQSVTLAVSLDGGQESQGKSGPSIHTPELTLTLRVMAEDALEAGGYRYLAEITGADARTRPGCPPELVRRFGEYSTKLPGTQLKFSATPRGVLHDLSVELPATDCTELSMITHQMSSILSDLVCRVPAEEVGAGARWRVLTPMGSEGYITTRTQELELTRIDKGRYSIRDAAMAKPQSVPKSPADPGPDKSVAVKDASLSTRMSYEYLPPYLMPTRAEGKVMQDLDAVQVQPDGKSVRIKQRITVQLRCSSKEIADSK